MSETVARLAFELAEDLQTCQHRRQLLDACSRHAERLGFEHSLVGIYLPGSGDIVTLSGYPDQWLAHYTESGYVHTDPVVRHCLSSTEVLPWSSVRIAAGRRGERERAFMGEAHAAGLRHGLSVPIHGAGAEGGMLSVASGSATPEHDPRAEPLMQFMAQSMHQSLKRIVRREEASSAPADDLPSLTERETECLRWTAAGKTSWEISRILGISENTVTFHLRNAIAKMQVSNRSQAVAKAVAQSLITLI